MPDYSNVLAIIHASDNPDQLRQFIENANRMDAKDVYAAAFRRLVEILPAADLEPVALDFWRSIHALEERLREERGKTVRLSRTRQKIGRVGVMKTLGDLALASSPSEGFDMLLERGMPDLTAEAVVLRHEREFEPQVVVAARQRLEGAGVEIDSLSGA